MCSCQCAPWMVTRMECFLHELHMRRCHAMVQRVRRICAQLAIMLLQLQLQLHVHWQRHEPLHAQRTALTHIIARAALLWSYPEVDM